MKQSFRITHKRLLHQQRVRNDVGYNWPLLVFFTINKTQEFDNFSVMANILLIEPFYASSHRQWADGLASHSNHTITLMTLPGRHWKWRMHGAAITLAEEYKKLKIKPELILTTDFLDVATFKALSGCTVPVVLYFHENQLTYPWSPEDEDVKLQRDVHYGFINYTSALAADKVLFNSRYHLESFLNSLPSMLKMFPDYQNMDTVDGIAEKSEVLYLGLELEKLKRNKPKKDSLPKVVLWNHRWEFDKNPESFFKILFELKKEQVPFRLIVCGESYAKAPPVFEEAKTVLKREIIHFGYAENLEKYVELLHETDILFVTSVQDFFGISIAEAAFCNATLLLPKRLTYPEIYDNGAYFYEDDQEAKAKLKQYLLGELEDIDPTDLVQPFDWHKQIKAYDNLFEKIIYGTENKLY